MFCLERQNTLTFYMIKQKPYASLAYIHVEDVFVWRIGLSLGR